MDQHGGGGGIDSGLKFIEDKVAKKDSSMQCRLLLQGQGVPDVTRQVGKRLYKSSHLPFL